VNRDFVEMLFELSAARAEFLVVGAYALAAHDNPRATKDIDIWIRPTAENAQRVWNALIRYGAPMDALTVADLAVPGVVFQIGVAPTRIDFVTAIDGVSFDAAWPNRITATDPDSGARYPVIGKLDLIANKRAAARPQDLLDAANLEGDPRAPE
jgi:hypothetical protein